MQSFIFSAKSVILMLVALPLSLCSNSDDSEDTVNVEPIVINFTEDFFTDCDQIQEVNGVKLSFTGISENENGCGSEIGVCRWNNNISLGFTTGSGNTLPSIALFGGTLEIDIDGLVGYKWAKITIDDNCGAGCTNANLYEGGNLISTEKNTVLGKDLEDLVIALTEDSSRIRIWSCEGAIVSILLELKDIQLFAIKRPIYRSSVFSKYKLIQWL